MVLKIDKIDRRSNKEPGDHRPAVIFSADSLSIICHNMDGYKI